MQQLPDDRPTATDLLNNSWVRGEKTAKHSMTEVAQKLREFNARRKFKVKFMKLKKNLIETTSRFFIPHNYKKFLLQAATHAVRATHRAIAMTHCHGEVIG